MTISRPPSYSPPSLPRPPSPAPPEEPAPRWSNISVTFTNGKPSQKLPGWKGVSNGVLEPGSNSRPDLARVYATPNGQASSKEHNGPFPAVTEAAKRGPHIFIRGPVRGPAQSWNLFRFIRTQMKTRIRMLEDSTGWYVAFDDSPNGRLELQLCFKWCDSALRAAPYPLHMEKRLNGYNAPQSSPQSCSPPMKMNGQNNTSLPRSTLPSSNTSSVVRSKCQVCSEALYMSDPFVKCSACLGGFHRRCHTDGPIPQKPPAKWKCHWCSKAKPSKDAVNSLVPETSPAEKDSALSSSVVASSPSKPKEVVSISRKRSHSPKIPKASESAKEGNVSALPKRKAAEHEPHDRNIVKRQRMSEHDSGKSADELVEKTFGVNACTANAEPTKSKKSAILFHKTIGDRKKLLRPVKEAATAPQERLQQKDPATDLKTAADNASKKRETSQGSSSADVRLDPRPVNDAGIGRDLLETGERAALNHRLAPNIIKCPTASLVNTTPNGSPVYDATALKTANPVQTDRSSYGVTEPGKPLGLSKPSRMPQCRCNICGRLIAYNPAGGSGLCTRCKKEEPAANAAATGRGDNASSTMSKMHAPPVAAPTSALKPRADQVEAKNIEHPLSGEPRKDFSSRKDPRTSLPDADPGAGDSSELSELEGIDSATPSAIGDSHSKVLKPAAPCPGLEAAGQSLETLSRPPSKDSPKSEGGIGGRVVKRNSYVVPAQHEDDLGNSFERPMKTNFKLITMALCAIDHPVKTMDVLQWIAENIPGYTSGEGRWEPSVASALSKLSASPVWKSRRTDSGKSFLHELQPCARKHCYRWDRLNQRPVSPDEIAPLSLEATVGGGAPISGLRTASKPTGQTAPDQSQAAGGMLAKRTGIKLVLKRFPKGASSLGSKRSEDAEDAKTTLKGNLGPSATPVGEVQESSADELLPAVVHRPRTLADARERREETSDDEPPLSALRQSHILSNATRGNAGFSSDEPLSSIRQKRHEVAATVESSRDQVPGSAPGGQIAHARHRTAEKRGARGSNLDDKTTLALCKAVRREFAGGNMDFTALTHFAGWPELPPSVSFDQRARIKEKEKEIAARPSRKDRFGLRPPAWFKNEQASDEASSRRPCLQQGTEGGKQTKWFDTTEGWLDVPLHPKPVIQKRQVVYSDGVEQSGRRRSRTVWRTGYGNAG